MEQQKPVTNSLKNINKSLSRLFRIKQEVQVDPLFWSKTSFIQIGYGVWVNLSSLTIGLAFGFSAIAIPQMTAPGSTITLTVSEQAWITSVVTLSAPIGCLVSGYFLDIYGRRMMMSLGQLPAALGWLLTGFAKTSKNLIIGRLVTGVGLGMLMTPPRIYVTEITLPNMRGTVGAFSNLALAAGMFLQAVMGSFLNWSIICFICAGFTMALSIVNYQFLPETPYYVLLKPRGEDDIEESLRHFRARKYEYFEGELEDLRDFKKNNVRELNCFEWLKMIFCQSSLKPFCLMIPYFVIMLMSGSKTLFFYTVEILQDSKSSVDPNKGAMFLALIRFVGGVISALLLYRVGRRPMAIISCLGCGVAFIYLGCHLKWYATIPAIQPLLSYTCYVFFACLGYYALTMLILFELLPLQVRGILGGAAQSLINVLLFGANEAFPYARMAITFPNTLIAMGTVSLLGTLYVFFFLPETRRLTLQEIEEFYKKRRPTMTSQRDLRASINISQSRIELTPKNLPRTKSLERHQKEKDPSKSRIHSIEASKRRTGSEKSLAISISDDEDEDDEKGIPDKARPSNEKPEIEKREPKIKIKESDEKPPEPD